MPLNPPTYTPLPEVGWAWLWVNGDLITNPELPNELKRFEYTRSGDGLGNFKFTLIDRDWTRIQSQLLAVKGGEVEFQFGYTNSSIRSPKYRGILQQVIPSFIIDAVQLEVGGLCSASLIHVVKKKWAHPDTRRGETYAPIHEYVQRILQRVDPAAGFDFDECDDEPKSYETIDGSDRTSKAFLQVNQTDYTFIKTVLCKYAVRKKDKVGSYIFYKDENTNTWHFHPPRLDRQEPSIPDFVFMRDPLSEVISFEVNHSSGIVTGAKGGERTNLTAVDQYNATIDTMYATNETTPEKPRLTFYKQELNKAQIQTKDHAAYISTFPVENLEMAKAMARDQYIRGMWAATTATLTIAGNYYPNLPGGENPIVRVIVMDPHNRVHYTSGLYYVSGVTDVVEAGIWTTQLHLMRDGSLTGAEEIIGKGGEDTKG